ncbi:MAG: tRNA (adenosine(37)-N6)-dimethylallyltransferase MiaA [Bdellovibrionota bacterium]
MVSPNLNFKCILILGATASGKTALAHNLADKLNAQNKPCELVNLDAFQIYKELNIGTAKPTHEEILKYNYHGVNICELNENLDANTFARLSWEFCASIAQKNKIPICVGGSGLYLRAFLHGLDSLPPRDENIRTQIKEVANAHGWPYCHEWLAKVDPKRACELHPNDKTRIERALEIFLLTGKPQSEERSKENMLKEQDTLFPCYVIHCKQEPLILKERICLRVEQIFAQGWTQEVEQLFVKYGESLNSFHAMQAIGYKQILSSLFHTKTSQIPQGDLVDKISTLTWQYAKKQLTWCAKEKVDFTILNNNEENIDDLLKLVICWKP